MRSVLPTTQDVERSTAAPPAPTSLASDCLAIVLAGGRGERLAPLTESECKPAVPFGATARIIDFTLSNCVNSGIDRIGLVTQFRQHALLKHMQSAWNFLNAGPSASCLELLPAQQDASSDWYSGTADAVHRNIAFLRRHSPRHVIVLAGDHVYKADFRQLLSHHVDSNADVTVCCHAIPRSSAHRFGIVECGPDYSIRRLVEKPATDSDIPVPGNPVLASMGIYVFSTECLIEALLLDAAMPTSSHDFGCDVLPRLIDAQRVVAYPFARNTYGRYWRDVGTLDSYYEAQMDLLRGDDVGLDLDDPHWPLHDASLHRSANRLNTGSKPSVFSDVLLGGGGSITGAQLTRCVVGSDCVIDEGAVIRDSVLLPGCRIGAGCELQRVIVPSDVELPIGSVIGSDPDLDARRFPATEDGVVVVTRDALAAIRAAGELAALCPDHERWKHHLESMPSDRRAA